MVFSCHESRQLARAGLNAARNITVSRYEERVTYEAQAPTSADSEGTRHISFQASTTKLEMTRAADRIRMANMAA